MSRPERIGQLLSQIQHETNAAFNEYWQLHDKCNDLEKESAKLREEIEAAKHDLQVFSMRSVQLDAENAKLRELVSSVLVLRHDPAYEWLDARLAEICGKGFTEQSRELGIEVDDVKTDHV